MSLFRGHVVQETNSAQEKAKKINKDYKYTSPVSIVLLNAGT